MRYGEDSAKLLARTLGPSWWPGVTRPHSFDSGKGWVGELREQRTAEPTAEKVTICSLLKDMSKLNVRGPASQNRCLFFSSKTHAWEEKTNHWGPKRQPCDAKEGVCRNSFALSSVSNGVPYLGDAACQVQVKLDHWFSAAGSKEWFPGSLESGLFGFGVFLLLSFIFFLAVKIYVKVQCHL